MFLGFDNDAYIQTMLLDTGLEVTHDVKSWKHYDNGFYLIARRRDLGPVACVAEANCHWYTGHAWLPHGGVVRFISDCAGVGLLAVLALWCCCLRPHFGGATQNPKVQ